MLNNEPDISRPSRTVRCPDSPQTRRQRRVLKLLAYYLDLNDHHGRYPRAVKRAML
jgi:hypothetical protein